MVRRYVEIWFSSQMVQELEQREWAFISPDFFSERPRSNEGFIILDYASRFPEAIGALAGWLKEGKLKQKEDVASRHRTSHLLCDVPAAHALHDQCAQSIIFWLFNADWHNRHLTVRPAKPSPVRCASNHGLEGRGGAAALERKQVQCGRITTG